MVSIVGFELSQARVWFHYYSYFLFFLLLGFKMFNDKIMGFMMNMHDAIFNFNSFSFVYAKCGNSNSNSINNLQIDGSQ
jgi:hypothetical protein